VDVTTEPTALDDGRSGERPLALHDLLWLLAVLGGVAFLLLEPLLTYPVFGSDTGEYFQLTQALASTGHISGSYGGWGSAYNDFPGIFLLSDAVAGATGSGAFSALSIVVPAVAALSVLPLFLLFRRIFPNDTIAIVGAALASVMMPRAFSLAHPAPLALGDLLVIAALWMFVEGRRDARWYGPLALTAGALVVTHHLSSYFFVVSALGSLLILELWKPGLWSKRYPTRELLFLGGFLLVLFAFWFVYARSFLPTVSQGGIGDGPGMLALFEAGAIVVTLASGLIVRARRARRPSPLRVRRPSDASILRDLAIILGVTLVGLAVILFVNLPGTSQTTSPAAIAFYAPIIVTLALASGSRRLLTATRLGPLGLTWLLALGVSAALAISTSDATLSPVRHSEYLVIPLGLLVAVAVGRLVARASDRAGRPALVAGGLAVVLLISANAAIAYPPPSDLGGFQEGLTYQDAALWGWAGTALAPPVTFASDHRLSSMLFGFDGFEATWDSTPALFTGANRSAMLAELSDSYAPHTLRPVDAVAVDAQMRSGVALDPGALAVPMSSVALGWLGGAPFVPLYENGPQAVYWVAGPVGG
jgi:hypothetical protein